jgi:hypothetical protein
MTAPLQDKKPEGGHGRYGERDYDGDEVATNLLQGVGGELGETVQIMAPAGNPSPAGSRA